MLPATSAQLSRNRGNTKTITNEFAKNPKKRPRSTFKEGQIVAFRLA